MIIEEYRNTTSITIDNTNDEIGEFILSTGDRTGRIVRLAIFDGNLPVDPTGMTCQFVIDQNGGMYEVMTPVANAETATWELAVTTSGLAPGSYKAAFKVISTDGSVTETIPFNVRILQGILEDGESGTEMQSALSDFEARMQAALDNANEAVTRANNVTNNVNVSYSNGILSVTDKTGHTETDDSIDVAITRANRLVTQLENVDVESATTAANEAADRADAAAEAVEALSVLGLSVVNGQVCQTYLKEV